jgi:SNF family Na+-dependent transporter
MAFTDDAINFTKRAHFTVWLGLVIFLVGIILISTSYKGDIVNDPVARARHANMFSVGIVFLILGIVLSLFVGWAFTPPRK